MKKIITLFIAGASFLVTSNASALTYDNTPVPMFIPRVETVTTVQILAKNDKKEKKLKKEKKDKKIKGGHENKGKHKGHNNEHSNSGEGKLKGLDRADEVADEHGHRDKARTQGKHGKD